MRTYVQERLLLIEETISLNSLFVDRRNETFRLSGKLFAAGFYMLRKARECSRVFFKPSVE